MTVRAIISPAAVQNMLEPLRRDRQLGDGARHSDGVVDRRRDRCAHAGDAAFARALDAERIERARRLLGEDHVDVGRLARGRHQIVHEARGQRIAAFVVDEFFVEPAAESPGSRAPRVFEVGERPLAISASDIEGLAARSVRTTLPSRIVSASTGACIISAAYSSAFWRTFSAALWVAEAVITVAREACAPMP